MTRVTGCLRCGRPYRPRLYMQPLCDDCLYERKRARAQRVHELAERIVREEGSSSERFGLRFGLYPLWAVEKAKRLLELERGQEAELSPSESSANPQRR